MSTSYSSASMAPAIEVGSLVVIVHLKVGERKWVSTDTTPVLLGVPAQELDREVRIAAGKCLDACLRAIAGQGASE